MSNLKTIEFKLNLTTTQQEMIAQWLNHHHYKDLASLDGIKIAYLFVDTPELLPEV